MPTRHKLKNKMFHIQKPRQDNKINSYQLSVISYQLKKRHVNPANPVILSKIFIFIFFMSVMVNIYSAPAKIAIIGDTEKCGVEIDLLTAKLAEDKDIILLDRSEIDKILAENEIFLSDISKQSVKIGKILGADAVIIIEEFKNENNIYIASRLVRVAEAVILDNIILPRGKSEGYNYSDAIAYKLKPAINKINTKLKDVTTISMLNIRNFDLDYKNQILSKQITKLLSYKLMMNENINVNERWNMAEVNFEKNISANNIDAKYMTGTAVLEGNLIIKNDNELTVKLILKFADSAKTKELLITGIEDNIPELINKISNSVLKTMNIANNKSNWDIQKEAKAYFEEAKWLYNCGFYKEAQSSADSASALGLKSDDLEMLRIKAYGGEPLDFIRQQGVSQGSPIRGFDYDSTQIIDDAIYLMENINLMKIQNDKNIKIYDDEFFYVLTYSSRILNDCCKRQLFKNIKYKYKIQRLRFLTRSFVEKYNHNISCYQYLFFAYTGLWNDTPEQALLQYNKALLGQLMSKNDAVYNLWYKHRFSRDTPCLVDWENGDKEKTISIIKSHIQTLWESSSKNKVIAILWNNASLYKNDDITQQNILKFLWNDRESILLRANENFYFSVFTEIINIRNS